MNIELELNEITEIYNWLIEIEELTEIQWKIYDKLDNILHPR